MKLEGIFLHFDKENGNGRIYPKKYSKDILDAFEKNKDNFLGSYMNGDTVETNLHNVTHTHKVENLEYDEENNLLYYLYI